MEPYRILEERKDYIIYYDVFPNWDFSKPISVLGKIHIGIETILIDRKTKKCYTLYGDACEKNIKIKLGKQIIKQWKKTKCV